VVECVGGIVQNQSVHLADADNDLKRVSEWVRSCNVCSDEEAERAPGELGECNS